MAIADRLARARQFIGIAEQVDSNPKAARKAAYRGAADEIAAHIAETGDTQKAVATDLGKAPSYVQQLLKWRKDGYKADTPWLADAKATSRARVSHAGHVLRDRTERRQAFANLTDDEKAEAAADLMSQPTVAHRVVSTPGPARSVVKTAAEDDFARQARERRVESKTRRLPTHLDQYFWSVLGKLSSWTTALLGIEKELAQVDAGRKAQALDSFVQLRDECNRCINILEGRPADGDDMSDVIDSTVSDSRVLELTS